MTERTFSEDEIRLLLKRSAELQRMQQTDHAPGLTLSELEQIAAESGIPPEFLRRALRESDFGITNRDVSGHTNTHAYVEHVVPGVLTEAEWEEVVVKLRQRYGNDMHYGSPIHEHGLTEQLGSMRSWRHVTGLGVASEFSIRSIDGAQHIRFERRVGLARPRVEGLGYGLSLALVAAAIMGGVFQSVWIALLVLAAVLAVAAPSIEVLDKRWRGKILREMKEVTDEVAQLIENPVSEESGLREAVPDAEEVSTVGKRTAGRISLDPDDPDAEQQAVSERPASKTRS